MGDACCEHKKRDHNQRAPENVADWKRGTKPEGARGCSRLEAWDKTVMRGEYLNHAENVTKHTIQRRLLFSDLED